MVHFQICVDRLKYLSMLRFQNTVIALLAILSLRIDSSKLCVPESSCKTFKVPSVEYSALVYNFNCCTILWKRIPRFFISVFLNEGIYGLIWPSLTYLELQPSIHIKESAKVEQCVYHSVSSCRQTKISGTFDYSASKTRRN